MHVRLSPIEVELTFIKRIDARNALDQGRFPGAVIPHKGHHFSRAHLKINLIECLNRAKRLRNPIQFEDWFVSQNSYLDL